MGRKLGDVPGLSDLLPSTTQILPSDYSVMQVDALGQVDAASVGLGDITAGMGAGGDPFAPTQGWADREEQERRATTQAYAQVDPMASTYIPDINDDGTPVVASGDPGSFDQEQLDNARTIAEVGKRLGASDRDVQIALMAAIVESNIRSLDYGDRDSIGIFQQRDAWGSREDRLDPAKSAEMFFLGGAAGQQGLLDVEDRDSRPMGDVAQDVQVSAYPDRYAAHEQQAADILASLSGETTSGSFKGKGQYDLTEVDGETLDNMTAAALQAATKEFGSDFSIMQGSHSHEVAASGGTHGGGGVVDLSVPNGDWAGAVAALRKIGFAAWVRNVPGYGSAGSGAHIHAVLIGNEKLSPEAQTQVQSYLNNDDGLAGSRADDGPRDFINNRFVWEDTQKPKPQADPIRQRVVRQAQQLVGTPFKWGGEDVDGLDAMGLIKNAYGHLGVELPKMAGDLLADSEYRGIDELQPGDLIGWQDAGDEGLGIWLGNGQFIEPGGPGRVVQLNDLGATALNAFGISMDSLLKRSQRITPLDPLNRPAPYNTPAPAPVRTTQIRPGTSVVEPHASIPAPPKPKPAAEGPLQETTFNQKPRPVG